MERKRGFAGVVVIVSVVGLIVSLAVLLMFFVRLNPGEEVDKKACHQSVLLRSTFNAGQLIEPGREEIPLNCEVEKICIFEDDGDCEDARGFVRDEENPIVDFSVEDFDSNEEAVLDIISESLVECHSLLGKGDLDFTPHSLFPEEGFDRYCFMCDRIVLDEELRNSVGDISYMDLFRYMERKTTSEGVSYLKFVYDVERASILRDIMNEFIDVYNSKSKKDYDDLGYDLDDLRIENFHINLKNLDGIAVMVQLSSGTALKSLPSKGSRAFFFDLRFGEGTYEENFGAGAVFFQLGGLSKIEVGDNQKLSVSSGPILYKSSEGNIYGRPTLYAYNKEMLSDLNCKYEFEP